MKFLKFTLVAIVLALFVSCSNESDVDENIKSLTINYKSQSFKLDYKIEDETFVLLTEYPDDLKLLQSNNNLSIEVAEDNTFTLVDNTNKNNTFSYRQDIVGDDLYSDFYTRFGLDKIAHYGLVVNSKNASIDSITDVYNTKKCWYRPVFKQKEYYINGETKNYTVDLTFGFSGKDQIEIFEGNANEDNIFGNFLKQQEGFHHLGFSVKNIDNTIASFNSQGYQTVVTGEFVTKLGVTSKLAFFDTREDIGVYTEVVESKLLGFNVNLNQGLYIFGLLIGDVKLECVN